MVNSTTCPSENEAAIDQTDFWSSDGIDWDAHRIGWAIAGGCALLTVILTIFPVLNHARHYTNRAEQRQIIRILYMPPVYAVISFFSYRFFRSYTYYSFIEVAYEAITLSAFLLLIIEYVAATAVDHNADNAIARKDKRKLPIPFCCWRYRPTKPYFMYTIKWSVLQYVIFRPLVSIAGIICEKLGVLCETAGWDFKYASVYLEIVDFISISVALYGLFVFYGLTKEEIAVHRPLPKFLTIKLIVFFTFYQSFVFDALEGRVIHATKYWSEANIADGLNALTICIEMVFFAIAMWWAYPSKPYTIEGARPTGIGRPLLDSINYSDFILEIAGSMKFYIDSFRGRLEMNGHGRRNLTGRPNFAEAFGLADSSLHKRSSNSREGEYSTVSPPLRASYDEDIRLAPYTYGNNESSTYRVDAPSYASGEPQSLGEGYRRSPASGSQPAMYDPIYDPPGRKDDVV